MADARSVTGSVDTAAVKVFLYPFLSLAPVLLAHAATVSPLPSALQRAAM